MQCVNCLGSVWGVRAMKKVKVELALCTLRWLCHNDVRPTKLPKWHRVVGELGALLKIREEIEKHLESRLLQWRMISDVTLLITPVFRSCPSLYVALFWRKPIPSSRPRSPSPNWGQGKSHPKKCWQIFLGKAKYFITILTKSLCGAAKLLFCHSVRFFQQNLPKMCIFSLWDGGKMPLRATSFQNFPGEAPRLRTFDARLNDSASKLKNVFLKQLQYLIGFKVTLHLTVLSLCMDHLFM
jgi:hypothetical protein